MSTMTNSYAKEFPLLQGLGLYAAQINGDGNCLFNALSDQLYGTQSKHAEIRNGTIDYMRANKSKFKDFLSILPGNATRRQPKRKNAGGYSTSFDPSTPTAAEIDRAFEDYIASMSERGTWGGNMELVAIAAVFNVTIYIYIRDCRYEVAAPENKSSQRQLHIAYHEWQHYSSIRNLEGPHQGVPGVLFKATETEQQPRPQQATPPPKGPSFHEWEVDIVQYSTSPPVARDVAIKALEENRGDVNNALDSLLASRTSRSTSSTRSSASFERGHSSDGSFAIVKKKQDRRISRATKTSRQQKKKEIASKLENSSVDSLESLVHISSAPRRDSVRKSRDMEESDDEWAPPALKDSDNTSGSEYSGAPATKITLKLSKPAESPVKAASKSPMQKRLMSARDKKDFSKQMQKAESKDRKKAAATTSKGAQSETPSMFRTSSQPGMTSGIQTLQI